MRKDGPCDRLTDMFRKASLILGNYYHIYNRGTDKREIFLNGTDYLRFTTLLYISNNIEPVKLYDAMRLPKTKREKSLLEILETKIEETIVDIGAYCLMPNHFHLLIREKIENGISIFMKKLCTAYVMYFNKNNERTGTLFQGRFKAELADKDSYLEYLLAYIHLNPIKLIEPDWKEKGIKNLRHANEFLDNYKWSSYPFYTGKKQNDPILNIKEFPDYFGNFQEFKTFINEWLDYQNTQGK